MRGRGGAAVRRVAGARRTVRVRLTVLYSGLFLITSTILLVIVNLLLRAMLRKRVTVLWRGTAPSPDGGSSASPGPLPDPPGLMIADRLTHAAADLEADVIRFQWGVSVLTILALTVVSLAVGWWLAGRVLSPLHRITATARRLSLSTLHERIALGGPRDELRDLADTFDAMLDRLERSADGQRRFVANASHELRTPLAIQRAAIEIGLEDPTPERLAEVRRDLLDANRRTERLIDGLLVLAQGDHGLDHREPGRLDEVVRQAVRAALVPRRTAEGADRPPPVSVCSDLAPVTVLGDPVLLDRMVANLLDNGMRYNHDGGSVGVRLTGDGVLEVSNTGPVVPGDRVAAMFEPFRRLHRSRTGPAGGAGLGLSIVTSIAQAHRAGGSARPNPGGGLTVRVDFDVAPPGAAAPDAAGAKPNGPTPDRAEPRGA